MKRWIRSLQHGDFPAGLFAILFTDVFKVRFAVHMFAQAGLWHSIWHSKLHLLKVFRLVLPTIIPVMCCNYRQCHITLLQRSKVTRARASRAKLTIYFPHPA